MRRIIVTLLVSIMALGLMATGAAASEHALGDLGKPADYDKTIKRFRDIIPDLDAYVDQLDPAFDWRTYGMVTVAKNQGSCGSCWAFASVGALESKILMMGRSLYNISEQQQVSCNTSQSGCSGGSATALQYWYTRGPMLESCTGYPSSGGSEPACSTLASCSQLPYHTTGYYTVSMTNAEIKTSLYNDGPTYFRFDCYSDFYDDANNFWDTAAPGAVYTQASGTNDGGHAVLIIGWDDAKGAWLLKNSWGATVGPNDDGTFWMAYTGHTNDLGFGMANVDASYATPDVLHKDGAIYRTATGWQTTTPPYYPGTAYAVDMEKRADGSSTVLHTDGAIWNSSTGWNTATPPYYPGTAYAKDLKFKSAPALIDEHFEGTFPPTGWSVKQYGSACVWQKSSVTGRTNYTGGTGYCADGDSDWCGSGATWPMNTDLWTPPLNLVGATSATLTFRTAYNDYGTADYASVDVTTDGGINWTGLLYWTADHSPAGPGELVTLDLTPFCGMSSVIVAFNYYAPSWDMFWEVDDVKVVSGVSSTTILHKDGALWNSAAGWTMTTPPYYPSTDYARDLEYRSNGSYLILHKYGAVYDSTGTSWRTTTPPYYPGLDYARAVQLKTGETNYVILHKDGALWSTDGGWVMTTPPYYAGSDYARGLEQVGSKYIILHKDGAIYDSLDGWYMGTPPYYSGTGYAKDLQAQ